MWPSRMVHELGVCSGERQTSLPRWEPLDSRGRKSLFRERVLYNKGGTKGNWNGKYEVIEKW